MSPSDCISYLKVINDNAERVVAFVQSYCTIDSWRKMKTNCSFRRKWFLSIDALTHMFVIEPLLKPGSNEHSSIPDTPAFSR